MSDTSNRLALAADQHFKESGREELEAFADILNVKFHPNIGDDTLRNRLLEALGRKAYEFPAEEDEQQKADRDEPVGDKPEVDGMSPTDLFRLNLTPDGKWQGRRRMITIQRPHESPKAKAPHAFRWGRSMMTIPYNKAVSVPYPFWEAVRNCEYKELTQKTRVSEDNVSHRVNHYEKVNRFSLTDLGDDQSTSNLPTSQKDQFRRIAEMTGKFKEYDRRKLVILARRLRLRIARNAEDGEIRDAVLAKLGYDTMMGFEDVA